MVALQEKQKELEAKFESLKRETKEADAQVCNSIKHFS